MPSENYFVFVPASFAFFLTLLLYTNRYIFTEKKFNDRDDAQPSPLASIFSLERAAITMLDYNPPNPFKYISVHISM